MTTRKIPTVLAFVAVFALGFALRPWVAVPPAHASVQTATPYVQSIPGGISISDPSLAVEKVLIDNTSQAVTLFYYYGTATTSAGKTTAFTPDLFTPPISVQFSLISNTWASSNGQSLTMTAGEITAVQAVIAGVNTATRDPGESFAISHSLFGSGATNYPW